MILENFRETIVLILLGNLARSVKFEAFEIISCKIGRVSSAMEYDTRELFCYLARDCNYRHKKSARCLFQKRIVLHETKHCLKALGRFCFLKLYMYIQIEILCT